VRIEPAAYLDYFHAAVRGAEPQWLAELRERSIQRFAVEGFPTRHDEEWRFNDLRPLTSRMFEQAPALAGAAAWERAGDGPLMVLANGFVTEGEAELPGLGLEAIRNLLREPMPELEGLTSFAALNAALFADGFSIRVAPGQVLDAPVEILHWTEAGAAHTRNRILAGAGSTATIIESFAGKGEYWTNAVTDIRVEAGAVLRHIKLQAEGADAVHLAVNRVEIEAGGRYESFVLVLGGQLSRHDVVATVTGAGAKCRVNGAYLLRGRQEATIATLIDHAAPGCETREVVKGVADEQSHGIFQGKFRVRREAQKTDAVQTNKNLLLSAEAQIDTKPELEILADDVKCSHGATVGDLDENALFYLRSRGIEEAEARAMLIRAFATDALDTISDEAARLYLDRHVTNWLDNNKAEVSG